MVADWLGDGPCEDCGGPNIRWSAPFELWDSVMDCQPGVSTGGIKCPQCFVRHAWDKGLIEVNWSLIPIPKGFGAKVPLEGRVVPTYHYYKGEPRELMRQWYASFIGTDGHWHEWDTAQADWRKAKDSANLAGGPTHRNLTSAINIRGFNFASFFARRIPVIDGVVLRRLGPVILHKFPLDSSLGRTLHRLIIRRLGVE